MRELRRVLYYCKSCDRPIYINVLGDKEVGRVRYKCQFCGHINTFEGEENYGKENI